jgi:hypothetical protein
MNASERLAPRAAACAVVGLWMACGAVLAADPQSVVVQGRTFADNVVIMGDDGQSSVMVQGDSAIVVFRRELELPASGGFFKRPKVWADRQDLRITTLDGQALVFLGNERVGTFGLPGGEAGAELFRFTEHGHTLRVTKIGTLSVDGAEETGEKAGIAADVVITRP